MKSRNIAIFASGSGTNAERIIRYFEHDDRVQVSLVLSNKQHAYVLERARKFGVPTLVFDRSTFYESDDVVNELIARDIWFIVLAGFLWLIPAKILRNYPGRIINIHPALLPGYGGKGMYGQHVHEAVLASGDKESGITIHYVNEEYDKGDVILQKRCAVHPDDTPDTLASRIHELEYEHYPRVIEKLLTENDEDN